jgi:hypothetical protein
VDHHGIWKARPTFGRAYVRLLVQIRVSFTDVNYCVWLIDSCGPTLRTDAGQL